jgi:hypothetical protein
MQNIQDIIKERYTQIPPELQQAIASVDLPSKFEAISKKYSLRIDQSGELQTETALIMLGLKPGSDFIKNLTENAELKKEQAQLIADEVNAEIFGKIRAFLRNMESAEDDTHKENLAKIKKDVPDFYQEPIE